MESSNLVIVGPVNVPPTVAPFAIVTSPLRVVVASTYRLLFIETSLLTTIVPLTSRFAVAFALFIFIPTRLFTTVTDSAVVLPVVNASEPLVTDIAVV